MTRLTEDKGATEENAALGHSAYYPRHPCYPRFGFSSTDY
jgi:hypothetical protein